MEDSFSVEDSSTLPSVDMAVDSDDSYFMDKIVTETTGAIISTVMFNGSFGNSAEQYGPGLPVRDPLYIVIPITVLYSVIFFTGVVGNVVTCIVISRNKHMHTATNYYLFSLAVSDLLLLVSGLPQEMYFIWSRYPYVFGEAFCVLRGLAAETSANATVLTITAFTVERYVAICHPFLSHTMSKLSRAIKLILIIWIVALAFAIPQAIQFGLINVDNPDIVSCYVKRQIMKHSFEVSTFLFFVAPMTLITVLYALIGLRLRRSNMMKKESGSFCNNKNQQSTTSGRHHQSQSSRRVLKMLVAVVVAFFICWAPFHAQRLVYIYGTTNNRPSHPIMLTIYSIMTYISGILYYVSTTINPILYQIMSLKFREAFKDTIARCCGFRSLKNSRARRTYSVLSRSAQRPMGASGGTNQDSTDYSGNSIREESVPTSCRSGLKPASSNDTLSRLQTPRKSHPDSNLGLINNGISPNSDMDARSYQRSFSVVLSTWQGNETSVRTTVVPAFSRQNTHSSQQPFLSSRTDISEKSKLSKFRNKDNYNLWKVLNCTDTSATTNESDQHISVVVPDISLVPSGENFTMLPVSVSDNSLSNVSNSSLRDVEKGALEDELTSYMQELQRREQC